MDVIQENAIFGQFLKDSFDVKEYTTQAIHQGVGIAEQLNRIAEGITLLNRQLREQVCVHYEDLLSHATAVETLEEVLKEMQIRIQALLSAVERLRLKVIEPYQKINSSMATLSRLQAACDLLRTIVRVSNLSKRLQTQMQGGSNEILKCAQTLSELGYLMDSVDLINLEILSKDQKFIRQSQKEIEQQAKYLLMNGMELQNQSDVGVALQVFQYLNRLGPTVQQVTLDAQKQLEESIQESLSVRSLSQASASNAEMRGNTPGRAAIPTIGNASAFKAALWNNMETLTDQIFMLCSRVQLLQKVLYKKTDPVSHASFSDILMIANGSSSDNIISAFLNAVTNTLANEFLKAANESTFIKQAFEEEYPKLLRLYSDLWRRLQQFSSINTANQSDIGNASCSELLSIDNAKQQNNFDPEAALRATLTPFENAYLSRSLSRLFDPINLKFTNGEAPPTIEEVEAALRVVTSELNVASIDECLAITVAKNVTKTVMLFATKCEQMLSTNGDATQVIGPPTQVQLNNGAIIDLLQFYVHRISQIVKELNPNFPKEAVGIIMKSMPVLHDLMQSAIQPLIAAIEGAIESIILTMHDEDFSMMATGENTGIEITPASAYSQCSLYMRELQNFVARIQLDYFSRSSSTDLMNTSSRRVARFALECFIRHATLVRPLGEGGKRKLAADCAQMEMCLSPLCSQLSELGQAYRMLRAFRPILFQTPEHIVHSSAVRDALSPSTVLHVLFSRAPPELISPHKTADWSIIQYSKWLDEHQLEKERLEFIKGALEAYVNAVRQRQGKEFSPIYLIMLEHLQNAMKNEH